MPSTQAIGPVTTAILAVLRANVSLTGYVGTRVYPDVNGCDVPGKATYPYLSVEGSDETPENTMGGTPNLPKFGSNVEVRIRIASNAQGDTQSLTLLGFVKAALDNQTLAVVGYPSVNVDYRSAPRFSADVAGVTIRERIAIFDVLVHQ